MMIKLSTGKEFYSHLGIIGIGPDVTNGDINPLFEGYDGLIYLTRLNDEMEPVFTQAELFEIADIAIERWNNFKKAVVLGIHPVIKDGR